MEAAVVGAGWVAVGLEVLLALLLAEGVAAAVLSGMETAPLVVPAAAEEDLAAEEEDLAVSVGLACSEVLGAAEPWALQRASTAGRTLPGSFMWLILLHKILCVCERREDEEVLTY